MTMFSVTNRKLSLCVIEATADEAQRTAYAMSAKYRETVWVMDLVTGEKWEVLSDD